MIFWTHFLIFGFSSKFDSYYRPDSIKRKLINIITNPYGYIKPNFVITSSKFTSKIFKSIYNVESKQLVTLGVPKTDYLLDSSDKINKIKSKLTHLKMCVAAYVFLSF